MERAERAEDGMGWGQVLAKPVGNRASASVSVGYKLGLSHDIVRTLCEDRPTEEITQRSAARIEAGAFPSASSGKSLHPHWNLRPGYPPNSGLSEKM